MITPVEALEVKCEVLEAELRGYKLSYEAVLADRDALRGSLEVMGEGYRRVTEERDALATRLEAIREAAYSEADGPGLRTTQQLRKVKALLDEAPK